MIELDVRDISEAVGYNNSSLDIKLFADCSYEDVVSQNEWWFMSYLFYMY